MSQLIMMIARIDDLDNPEQLTEVWRRAMPVVELNSITSEHYLDGLESAVTEVGWEAMRQMLVAQCFVGQSISAGASWDDIGRWV